MVNEALVQQYERGYPIFLGARSYDCRLSWIYTVVLNLLLIDPTEHMGYMVYIHPQYVAKWTVFRGDTMFNARALEELKLFLIANVSFLTELCDILLLLTHRIF